MSNYRTDPTSPRLSGPDAGQGATARTVLGDIPADSMGVTLPHEHLACDASAWHVPSDHPIAEQEPSLENQWWFRAHPDSNRHVLQLDDERTAIDELAPYREAGGGTLVELSCTGLHGDPVALARISRASGVNVIAGCGFYVASTHPASVSEASVDDLADYMVDCVETGIDDSGVRAGVIGELGMSWPLHPDEEKVLRAAARAQARTGAAISVHTAIHSPESRSALVAADLLADEGADLARVVMGHLDASLPQTDYHLAIAERGCWLQFDTFGCEYFESEADFVWASDRERTRAVAELVSHGLGDRLMLSQDIYIRIQWRRYGGCGYAHILENIVPRLRIEKVSEETIATMLVDNPSAAFPLARSQGDA